MKPGQQWRQVWVPSLVIAVALVSAWGIWGPTGLSQAQEEEEEEGIRPPPPRIRRAQPSPPPAPAIDEAKLHAKLDKILDNQRAILEKLDKVTAELGVIKIRATMR